ncbi:hypothetical protein BO86DRAFT_167310 [Aspergillus japonicus CBS 114.51]|uniref:Uncharacterized protein n=1 Tax=Aspergillus japonicus CBS 114.51 TaxID=1448312 RepID=A0A8T8XCM1_ASPJA|nr:hypothetical protein BO86DRAFT_167310 [Aspergillus japonicus CBS 114.51]RAH85811.1 hypothetical protein BO86DRAFT_167310 [Aspergillus japonicus CBS 114.51]
MGREDGGKRREGNRGKEKLFFLFLISLGLFSRFPQIPAKPPWPAECTKRGERRRNQQFWRWFEVDGRSKRKTVSHRLQ